MRKKPDILLVLVLMFGMGVLVSNYTVGQTDPQEVAKPFVIR